MKVSLPYFYEVEHQADGKEPILRDVVGFVDCDVKEVSPSETDLVACWKMNTGIRSREGIPVSCVRHNGNLYIPALDRDGNEIRVADLMRSRRSQYVASTYPRLRDLYHGAVTSRNIGYLAHEYTTGKKNFGMPRTGSILRSNEELCAAAVTDMANRLFNIEGKIWHQASWLHIKVFKARDTVGRNCLFQAIDYSKNGGRDWHCDDVLGPDDYKNPRISLNGLHYAQHFTSEEQYPNFHDLRIEDESAFILDGRAEYAARVMDVVVTQSGRNLGNYGDSEIAQWLQMRDAFGAYLDDRQCSMSDEVIQTFRSFSPVYDLFWGKDIMKHALSILDTYDDLGRQPNIAQGPDNRF